ncbi:hypothetical protein [Desulfitobacterium metallireducens]|uniref:Uncharacterized protein n=1 Tax=Desulfitobacterium metallireducens DSM 15288 TaxID=871968 RepID=W0EFV3_9FIRM|nr:hypothetical protein [Desulfitobacterium metallireducens]AHF08393.1 hypothetical protein DESME_01725 [Desulfitobacterium metallireducens DSM 15288]
MNEMDNLWAQLFQEEPLCEASLQNLKTGVMAQILDHPIDFQAKILMAQRRKWGAVLLAALVVAGLGVFSLLWFQGEWLLSMIGYVPGWLLQQGKLFSQLIIGVEYLWQLYVWPFLGVAIAWVLFDGIRNKMLIRE